MATLNAGGLVEGPDAFTTVADRAVEAARPAAYQRAVVANGGRCVGHGGWLGWSEKRRLVAPPDATGKRCRDRAQTKNLRGCGNLSGWAVP